MNLWLMRLVGRDEARTVEALGQLVESKAYPGAGITRVFLSEELQRMMQALPDRTHLVIVEVSAQNTEELPYVCGDGYPTIKAYVVDVEEIHRIQVGKAIVRSLSPEFGLTS